MNSYDRIRKFFGIKGELSSEVRNVLKDIIDFNGPEILNDRVRMENELRQKEISEIKIMQIIIMLSVSGLNELIQNDERTAENDLDRYIRNAQEETGLSRDIVIDLAADIAYALGYSMVENYDQYSSSLEIKKGFVIPYSVYEKELSEIRELSKTGKTLNEEQLKKLSLLCEQKIPEAQLYMSKYIYDYDKDKAQEYLYEAATGGCPEALATLGDYFYSTPSGDCWDIAYKYYSGEGAAAMNSERQNAFRNILNQKKYNKRVLGLSLLFFVGIALIMIFEPGAASFGTNVVLRTIATIFEVVVWGVAVLHYRAHPYTFLKWLIPVMFGIWWCYLLFWILI